MPDQTIIKRYAANGVHPAQRLYGTATKYKVLRATAATKTKTPPAIVVTEDFNAAVISEWQAGTTVPDAAPAILQPEMWRCSIQGLVADVNDQPWKWNVGHPDLYHGAILRANGTQANNLNFQRIPGTALAFSRDSNPRNGWFMEWDRVAPNIRDINIKACFRGVDAWAVDANLDNVDVEAFRDYGVKLNGAIQYSNLHTYGGGWGIDGPGVWFAGDVNQGANIYAENSPVGVLFTANRNRLVNLYSKTCDVPIRFGGTFNTVIGFEVTGSCEMNNQYNTLSTGEIKAVSGKPAIKITNGMGQDVLDVRVNVWGVDDPIALECAADLTNCTIRMNIIGGKGKVIFKNPPNATNRIDIRGAL